MTGPQSVAYSAVSYLEDVPRTDGVVFVACKQDPPTPGEVQGRSPEHEARLGVELDLLIST